MYYPYVAFGIDGTSPAVNPVLTSIYTYRYEVGFRTGEILLDLIRAPNRRRSTAIVVNAIFNPEHGRSIIV